MPKVIEIHVSKPVFISGIIKTILQAIEIQGNTHFGSGKIKAQFEEGNPRGTDSLVTIKFPDLDEEINNEEALKTRLNKISFILSQQRQVIRGNLNCKKAVGYRGAIEELNTFSQKMTHRIDEELSKIYSKQIIREKPERDERENKKKKGKLYYMAITMEFNINCSSKRIFYSTNWL